jgi:hypothetical protein
MAGLVLLYIVAPFITLISFGSATYAYSGGDGTAASPYRIASCDDLENMQVGVPGIYYSVVQNIDCSNVNGGAGFTPIGGYSNGSNFEGSLDGRGHSISNVTINASGQDNVGLFNELSGATVMDLKLDSFTVNDGGSDVGTLAASAGDSTIQDIGVTGVNLSGGDVMGGLIGHITNQDGATTVNRVSTSGTITSNGDNGDIGGVTGEIDGSSITDAYSTISISAPNGGGIGGIAGSMTDGSTITNTYATGAMSSSSLVGGIVGYAFDADTISNSFAIGALSSGTSYVGGILGATFSAGAMTFSSDYYDAYATGQTHCTNDTNDPFASSCFLVDADGSDAAHFQDTTAIDPLDEWDFTNTWSTTSGYPTLQDAPAPSPLPGLSLPTAASDLTATNVTTDRVSLSWTASSTDGGSAITYHTQYKLASDSSWTDWSPDTTDTTEYITNLTPGQTYNFHVVAENYSGTSSYSNVAILTTLLTPSPTISNCYQLQDIQNNPTGNYILTGDIDCSGTDNWNYDADSGTYLGFTPITGFSGGLDGNGHAINGLFIQRPASDNVGIFADIDGGTVLNLTIGASYPIVGANNVGSLAGTLNGGTITEVTSNISVAGLSGVGDLIGHVYANDDDATISDSSAIGNLSTLGDAPEAFGGLVGNISAAYGNVTLPDDTSDSNIGDSSNALYAAGGLVGSIIADNNSIVSITGSSTGGDSTLSGNDSVGGLVGYLFGDFDIGTTPADVIISQDSSRSYIVSDGDTGGLIGGVDMIEGATAQISQSYVVNGGIESTGADDGGLIGYIVGDANSVSLDQTDNLDDVYTSNANVGGLVGDILTPTTITNSYSTGTIYGTSQVGGLVGSGLGNYSNDYSSADINGQGDYVGGLVGEYDDGTLSNSFYDGNLTDGDESDVLGAIVGGGAGNNPTTVSNAYYDGVNSNGYPCVGDTTYVTVTSCTAVDTDGSTPNYFTGSMNTPPLDQWNFDDIWLMHPAADPTLIANNLIVSAPPDVTATDIGPGHVSLSWTMPASTSDNNAAEGYQVNYKLPTDSGWTTGPTVDSGSITSATVYGLNPSTQYDFEVIPTNNYGNGDASTVISATTIAVITNITTCAQLEDIGDIQNTVYTLAQDIDCSDTVNWNGGAGFIPIGEGQDSNFNHSILDGQGHKIIGLYENRTDGGVGLFAQINDATVKNLTLSGGSLTGTSEGGAFAETSTDLALINCSSNLPVTVTDSSDVGGLIGSAHETTGTNSNDDIIAITHSFATGAVTGDSAAGGLVGYSTDYDIYDSYYNGTVTSTGQDVGGIIGYDSQSVMQNVYAAGQVIGTLVAIGGLVGLADSTDFISYSFSASSVIGMTADPDGGGGPSTFQQGALVGSDQTDGNLYLTDDYYDSTLSNQSYCGQSFDGTSSTPLVDPNCTAVNVGNSQPDYFFNTSTAAPLDQWDFTVNWVTNANTYPTFTPVPASGGGNNSGGNSTPPTAQPSQTVASSPAAAPVTHTAIVTPTLSLAALTSSIAGSLATTPSAMVLNDYSDYSGNGHQVSLNLGQVVYFHFTKNGQVQQHSATVTSISGNAVTLSIHSTPFTMTVNIGQTKMITIDGTKVATVAYNELDSGLAVLTFKVYQPTVSTATTTGIGNSWLWLLIIPVVWILYVATKRRCKDDKPLVKA